MGKCHFTVVCLRVLSRKFIHRHIDMLEEKVHFQQSNVGVALVKSDSLSLFTYIGERGEG